MHKIFMYLTHKEYDDMIAGHHTASVTSTYMKIYNLGNRTPFVASSGTVQYANANSQTTIGIWEDMGRHGMIKLGENITPATLYGKKIGELTAQTQYRQVAGDNQSAACQEIILGHQPITSLIKNPIERQPDPVSVNVALPERIEVKTRSGRHVRSLKVGKK
ncbi:hypothetical protein ACJJTC_013476 [Scirpophaga incertulas]